MMADSMLVPGRGLDGDAAGTPEFSHPWENSTRPLFAPAPPGLRKKLDAPHSQRRAPGPSESVVCEWFTAMTVFFVGDIPERFDA